MHEMDFTGSLLEVNLVDTDKKGRDAEVAGMHNFIWNLKMGNSHLDTFSSSRVQMFIIIRKNDASSCLHG